MKALSTSEEQVMAALWACGKPATRRQIAAKLPPDCVWADSTLLNFLLRLEAKGYVRPEKQGNKNIYTPLVRRVTYCGAVSAAHLQTLYGGDLRSMVAALSDTGRITNAEMERLARWLDTAWPKARNTITIGVYLKSRKFSLFLQTQRDFALKTLESTKDPAALCLKSRLCLRNIRHFLCFQIHLKKTAPCFYGAVQYNRTDTLLIIE